MKTAVRLTTVALLILILAVSGAHAGSVMDRIVQSGVLTIGTSGTQPTMTAMSKSGDLVGLDIDLAKSIADNMGVKLKLDSMAFDKLLPALESGRVDMVISGMTMTMQRNRRVAFVGPYYISGKGILTRIETVTKVEASGGLNDPQFTVAVLRGSTSQAHVEKSAPKAQLKAVDSYDQALEMLLADQVHALVADLPYCVLTAYRNKGRGLTAGESRLTFEPLGMAVLPDPLMLNWLDNYMMMLDGSGALKKLQERWLIAGPWIEDLK